MTTVNQDILYKRSQASVWIQPSGPGTQFVFLNCAGMEGFQRNEGDVTLRYCKDESQSGKFKVIDSYQGQQGPVTSSLVLPFGKAANYALSLRCPINLQVRFTSCGRADDSTNWEKILHFSQALVTQRSSQPLVARNQQEEGEVLITAAISATDLLEIRALLIASLPTTSAVDLLDITFDNTSQCEGACGAASDAGTFGYAVGKAGTYPAASHVLRTANGGGTWTATAADPFSASQDLSAVVMNGTRVIVGLGTTDAAAPAKIAYSDDNGATWTRVTVGSVNAQYIRRLIWLSKPYLWVVTSGGYIYFSADAGLTWTAQDSGVVTTQIYADVDFTDNSNGVAVGASNAVARTVNGGLSWSAVTGPAVGVALNTIEVVDAQTWFIGDAGGNLWKTANAGSTWTQVRFTGDGVGQVRDVEFYDNNFGFMIVDTAAPLGRLLRTIDGGLTWAGAGTNATPTNAGLNRVAVVNANDVYVAGNKLSSLSIILEAN